MWTLAQRIQNWWQTRGVERVSAERARQRVARGASYLDEVDPGWYRRVDPHTLSLSSGRHCVLGQLHGEFRMGLGRSHLVSMSSAPRASLSPVAYGFKCVEGVPDAWQERDYELLTAAWRQAVQARRAAELSGDGHAGDSTPELTITGQDDSEPVAA
ncbi:MAG: hypothetical protein ACLFTE_01115 [Salinivenus sp.]